MADEEGDELGFFAEYPISSLPKPVASKEKPHYLGHRDRLRERFVASGASMPDYELLELILFRSLPMRDTKPLAKALLKRFGSLAEVLGASPALLREVKGVGQSVAIDLKVVAAAAGRMARGEIQNRE